MQRTGRVYLRDVREYDSESYLWKANKTSILEGNS